MSQITTGIRTILSGPIFYDFFQNIMGAKAVRQELVREFIQPEAACRILDFGCGTAEILEDLPSNIEYFGYDISPKYIEAANRKYGARGSFNCKSINDSELRNLPKFDRVLAMGVLHHLDDEEAELFFAIARQALKCSGRVVTIDPCLAAGQNQFARFLIQKDRGQNVRNVDGYRALAQGVFANVKGTLRHRAWIPYTHWIMECSQ